MKIRRLAGAVAEIHAADPGSVVTASLLHKTVTWVLQYLTSITQKDYKPKYINTVLDAACELQIMKI